VVEAAELAVEEVRILRVAVAGCREVGVPGGGHRGDRVLVVVGVEVTEEEGVATGPQLGIPGHPVHECLRGLRPRAVAVAL